MPTKKYEHPHHIIESNVLFGIYLGCNPLLLD